MYNYVQLLEGNNWEPELSIQQFIPGCNTWHKNFKQTGIAINPNSSQVFFQFLHLFDWWLGDE